MNVTVSLPEEFAARFGAGPERDRQVLEALALAEYRAGRLSLDELQQVLGLPARGSAMAFLRERDGSPGPASAATPGHAPAPHGLWRETEGEAVAAAADLVRRSRDLRAGTVLGGLDLKELIEEGRR